MVKYGIDANSMTTPGPSSSTGSASAASKDALNMARTERENIAKVKEQIEILRAEISGSLFTVLYSDEEQTKMKLRYRELVMSASGLK